MAIPKKINEKQLSLMKAEESLNLSKIYLAMAKRLRKDPKSIRGVIDTGYNAAELSTKGLLWLKLKRIPRTHKGIVQKFGEIYIKTDKIEKEIGRKLSHSLVYRNLARYEAKSKPTKTQAEEIIDLTMDLQNILKNELRK